MTQMCSFDINNREKKWGEGKINEGKMIWLQSIHLLKKWDEWNWNKLINQMLLIDSFGVLVRCVIMLKCLIMNLNEMMLFN